ncbi:MAG: hypothetical protein ACPGWR_32300 [Ardenticatenaceae bacterium]
MNAFPLWRETDRLCGKCHLYLAEPRDWLCQKCHDELEGKWKQVTGEIEPDPLEAKPMKIPWRPFAERSVAEPFAFNAETGF